MRVAQRRARLLALAAAITIALPLAASTARAAPPDGPTLLDLEVGDAKAPDVVRQPQAVTPSAVAVTLPAAAPPAPASAYPRVELHGYFRFRPDVLVNGHLGQAVSRENDDLAVLTTSAVRPPLSLWPSNADSDKNAFSKQVGAARKDETLAGATMRLRLAPTLHVHETIRLRMTVDAMDNYVMGSSPDFAGSLRRPDVPLSAFAMTSRPGFFRIHEAYGEWKTLFGLLRVGRQGSHWGLGMLASGGNGTGWDGGRPIDNYYGGALLPHQGYGYDADYGNYADRAAFVTRIAGTYVALFWDYISSGAIAYDPTRFDGVPFDMDESDDASQVGIAIFRKPLSEDEIRARRTALVDEHRAVLDWGLYSIFRTQELDTSEYVDGNGDVVVPAKLGASQAKNLQLIPREAWAMAGDLWLRYENRLAFDKRLVVEAEFAYLTGKVGDASALYSVGTAAKERSLNMWGGALKAAYQDEGLGIYFDAGVASGDHNRCFGVSKLPNCSLEDAAGNPDGELTAFKFHRNYRVDSILFRDVIGTVTNAWYVKPTVSINAHPFYALTDQLGLDISLLHAGAMNIDGTPGYGSTLGTELEARAFLGLKDLLHASVTFAYMIPGDALDMLGPNAPRDGNCGQDASTSDACRWDKAMNSVEATSAWRIMSRLALMF